MNGSTVKVDTLVDINDQVKVNGTVVTLSPTRLFVHHKLPKVLVTHANDPNDTRMKLFSHLKKMGLEERLVSVGRLDYNTEGLILLTNSGGLARYLELPKHRFERKYLVEVSGSLTKKKVILIITIISFHF